MTMSRLKTPLCETLGIELPVINAGMAEAAGVDLTVAVSNAGGLGVLGATMDSPEELREKIRAVRSLTDKPFGVDLLLPANVEMSVQPLSFFADQIPDEHKSYVLELGERCGASTGNDSGSGRQHALGTGAHDQIEVVFEEKVPVFVSGLGNPGFLVERAHAQGMKVMAVVGNVKNAIRVADGGVDAVVAQGTEAGGHTGQIGTFVLLPQVVDAVSPVPVVAAGGVGDGRGLAAALVLGCQAVWVGTRFLATPEAHISDWRKQGIVDSDINSTRVSRSYTGKPARMLQNMWMREWENAPVKPLPMPLQDVLIRPVLEASPENPNVQPNAAGQVSGMVKELTPAREIVEKMVSDAVEILSALPNELPS